jgi:hypothetical protein
MRVEFKWLIGILAFLFILGIVAIAVSNDEGNTTAPVQTNQSGPQATPATQASAAQSTAQNPSTSDFEADMQGWTQAVSQADTDAGTQMEGASDGTISQSNAASALITDKQQVDSVVNAMQGTNPPAQFQQVYDITLQAFQETSQSLQDSANGLNDNDPNEIQSGTDLANQATANEQEANDLLQGMNN